MLISAVLLISGAVVLGIFKLNLGIDFSSGTRVEVLADHPLTTDEISSYLDEIGHPTDDIVISGDTGNMGVMRYKDEFKQEEVNKLKVDLAAEFGSEPNISTVSDTVGKELVKNAIICIAYCYAWYCHLRCISFRMAYGGRDNHRSFP